MKRGGRIRRVVLPVLWLVIGALVAASLVKLAFLGGNAASGKDDPLKPTGAVPAQVVPVELGAIKNTLTVEGDVPPFPLDAAFLGLAVSVGVGALAGVLPALLAARVKIVDAIRF